MSPDNIEHFSGDKLQARRLKMGLGINDVVARLWLMGHEKASVQLLNNYESGDTVPGIEYALSLASILKCSVHYFSGKKE